MLAPVIKVGNIKNEPMDSKDLAQTKVNYGGKDYVFFPTKVFIPVDKEKSCQMELLKKKMLTLPSLDWNQM